MLLTSRLFHSSRQSCGNRDALTHPVFSANMPSISAGSKEVRSPLLIAGSNSKLNCHFWYSSIHKVCRSGSRASESSPRILSSNSRSVQSSMIFWDSVRTNFNINPWAASIESWLLSVRISLVSDSHCLTFFLASRSSGSVHGFNLSSSAFISYVRSLPGICS